MKIIVSQKKKKWSKEKSFSGREVSIDMQSPVTASWTGRSEKECTIVIVIRG